MGVAAARPHPKCGVAAPRAPLVKNFRNHHLFVSGDIRGSKFQNFPEEHASDPTIWLLFNPTLIHIYYTPESLSIRCVYHMASIGSKSLIGLEL